MSKIFLISCPPWGVVMPPLGIAYLATYLKSRAKEVEVYDLNLALYKKANDRQRQFWDLDTINKVSPIDIAHDLFYNFEKDICRFISDLNQTRIIGFSANNLISTAFAGILASRIKTNRPDKIIILGGPGCFHSWDRKTVPEGAVDFFIIGEGEEVLDRFIDTVEEHSDISKMRIKIPGLLQNTNIKRKQFYPPAYIKALDLIPSPSFEEFNLADYNHGKKYRPLPMLMSRGCINRCSYCIDWYMCSAFRVRDPANIIAEIEHHVKSYKITHIEFNDLLCNGNLVHLEKFCDQLISSKIDVKWISYAAIRKNMSAVLLSKMKKAGCNSLCFGIESGSNAVLKNMKKHYTKEDAAWLIKRTYEAGIEVRINIIVGFPGETDDDFQQTLEFIKENRKFITQVTNVSSFVLMPGADLAIYPHSFGISYHDETDPGTWTDAIRTTQRIRNIRVQKTCEILKELGIGNLIVNFQKETCKGQDLGELKPTKKRLEKNSISDWQSNSDILKNNWPQKKRLLKISGLFLLFIISVIMDFYLMLLKKIRGSIIFPGS